MDKDFVLNYLKVKNYWWTTGRIDEKDKGLERPEYVSAIEGSFSIERIIALSGLRRSGKTTILFQIIDDLVKKNDPRNIVYFKMDDLMDKAEDIHEVIKAYSELTGKDPLKDELYFFIDEIHVMKNWQTHLKYYIDSHAKSKYVVSGSSKTLLYKDASESLAGRIKFIDVFPLTFREFITFSGTKIRNTADFQNPEEVKKLYYDILEHKEKILHLFNEYLEVGGFPEWFKIKNYNTWQKTLEDYLSIILFKDIVTVFNIKDPILLEKLVKETAKESTNRFSYLNLSNRLDTDRSNIKTYLYYLRTSMLIYISESYTKNKTANERKEKKIYFWEEGLRKAITLDTDPAKAVENIVAWHLTKKGSESKIFYSPYYWKDKYEIDYVYDDGKSNIPIEVKYGAQIPDTELRSLKEYSKEHNPKKAMVITRDTLETRQINGVTVYLIPAWLFLLTI